MTGAPGKSRQFCSVCKDWLDMEVVPTGDADEDDGVVWFRCPQCQGFLPKLMGAEDKVEPEASEEASPAAGDDLPWDSPAAMMKQLKESQEAADSADLVDSAADDDDVLVGQTPDGEDPEPSKPMGVEGGDAALPDLDQVGPELESVAEDLDEDTTKDADDTPDSEPLLEYAAMLADVDIDGAVPYRPWDNYEVGQCVNHLAWDDCGVVVAKEELPGGRRIIKCYFEEAGIVRLIEQAPR